MHTQVVYVSYTIFFMSFYAGGGGGDFFPQIFTTEAWHNWSTVTCYLDEGELQSADGVEFKKFKGATGTQIWVWSQGPKTYLSLSESFREGHSWREQGQTFSINRIN